METCKLHSQVEIWEALRCYRVNKYQSILEQKVNDLCLEMGYLYSDDKLKLKDLFQMLTNRIKEITENESERLKLSQYADRVVVIGRNYRISTSNSF
jgi:hypothetical protein